MADHSNWGERCESRVDVTHSVPLSVMNVTAARLERLQNALAVLRPFDLPVRSGWARAMAKLKHGVLELTRVEGKVA